ncbi:sulfurtransferase, partial [Bacteroides thetaiotaomicron]|uniref:sulfurtransferase n=1 Tax=Bacteroides thetaiotaomicron TaxID=818 RepID=UPI001D96CBA4
PNSRFRSIEDLKKTYGELLEKDEIITYCQIGERGTHTWFVLKYLLGHSNVRNYDGSCAEWGNMVRMPIARGEEPGEP